jgi:FK506-binding protein 15
VLAAVSVDCQKHVGGAYKPQGKLGCAVFGLHSSKDYNLLLYQSNNNHVSNTRIDGSFSFTVQSNNYASYYDDSRQAWSLRFNTTEDLVKIAREVALCKANVNGMTQLVKQDLILGDGQV